LSPKSEADIEPTSPNSDVAQITQALTSLLGGKTQGRKVGPDNGVAGEAACLGGSLVVRASRRVRQLEQRLETVLATESGWRLRGIF
jgi:hypothetical protein